MIKVLNQYFPRRWAVLLVGESLLIVLALLATVLVESQGWPADGEAWGLISKVVLITLICQVCLHYGDLYAPDARPRGNELVAKLLQGLGIASIVLALVYWLLPEVRLSTDLVVIAVIAILVILAGWRRAMDAAMRWAHRAFPVGERLLIVGAGERAWALARELQLRPQLGLSLVGVVSEGEEASSQTEGVPIVGRLADMEALLARHRPHRIALALEASTPLPQALMSAWVQGVRIEESPTLFEHISGRIAIGQLRPGWLVLSDCFHKSRLLRFYQRASSIAAALAGIVILSPLLALIALAIKLDSPGPVLYRQRRVGWHGREFDICKFRSMRADAESATGPVWAQENDPRITRSGRWLRKLRLDELPQLFNVLAGTMSLVGPRPERPRFVAEFSRAIPYYDMRHSVRPGITGWAQVNRDYGASLEDAREKLEYDLFYVKNLSVWLDLFIVFQTTKIVFLGRGAR